VLIYPFQNLPLLVKDSLANGLGCHWRMFVPL